MPTINQLVRRARKDVVEKSKMPRLQAARDVMSSSDILLGVLNIDEKKPESLEAVLEFLKEGRKPTAFVIHKTDLEEFHRRLSKIRAMIEKDFPGAAVFEVSSKKMNQGIKTKLLEHLASMLPERRSRTAQPPPNIG